MFRALLVAKDDATLAIVEQACLERGYLFGSCTTARDAESTWNSVPHDLVILDWPLPGGHELCAHLRGLPRGVDFYVLGLVKLEAVDNPADVLAAGCDDYITRPFDRARLSARLAVAERNLRRIVAQRRAEESQRETAEQLALAAAGTNDGFWYAKITSDDWFRPSNPVWYSLRMKNLLGFADHEMENVLQSWSERLHPDDRARIFQALEDHFQRRIPYDIEYRLRVRSGEYRWFCGRGQAQWDAAGRPTRFAGSVRDVTERHLFDEALRESESRHRLIAETVNDIIWAFSLPHVPVEDVISVVPADSLADMALHYVSPAIERVLGYMPAEACQMPLRQLLSPRSYEQAMAALAEEWSQDAQTPDPTRQRTLELEYVTKTGESRWCEVTSVFIRDLHEQPTGVLGVSRDITERKQTEVALRKERSLLRQLVDIHERERQLFAYEIHDAVVQHLTAALMHLEVFSESRSGASEVAQVELARGLKLLRTAVSESRRLISGLRPPILDEAGIVAAIEYLINENREVLSEVDFHHDTHFQRLAPPLENAVFRVVQEALTNVRRHSGCHRAHVQLLQIADRLRVEVRDWGIGFDPEQVQDDRFGLQGIRERARLLGGQATITSSVGEGTCVCVEFPLPLPG